MAVNGSINTGNLKLKNKNTWEKISPRIQKLEITMRKTKENSK